MIFLLLTLRKYFNMFSLSQYLKEIRRKISIMLCVLTYRWQQNNSPRMDKQTGPKHGKVLSETVGCVECAALQWL